MCFILIPYGTYNSLIGVDRKGYRPNRFIYTFSIHVYNIFILYTFIFIFIYIVFIYCSVWSQNRFYSSTICKPKIQSRQKYLFICAQQLSTSSTRMHATMLKIVQVCSIYPQQALTYSDPLKSENYVFLSL